MIIFGCGYTGERVAWRRAFAGERVLAVVSRSERAVELSQSGIDTKCWNLDEHDRPPEFAQVRSEPVVYLVPPPRDGNDDTRIERALGAVGSAVTRFVYISTTGVYGNRDGEQVNEDDRPRAESPRAVRRLAAETRVRDWADRHGVPWMILRVPGIYGPGRLQLATVREGRPMLRAEDAGPGNRIHVDDLASAIDAAATSAAPSQIINVGDGNAMTNTEFVAEVARQLGEEPPPQLEREALREQISEQAWSFLRESRRVDVTRMREVLKVSPRYAAPADGIAASLTAMREAGSL